MLLRFVKMESKREVRAVSLSQLGGAVVFITIILLCRYGIINLIPLKNSVECCLLESGHLMLVPDI